MSVKADQCFVEAHLSTSKPGSRADVVDSKTNRCLDLMRLRVLCHASFCPVLAVLARALPGHRNTVENLRDTIEDHADKSLSWLLHAINVDPDALPAMAQDAESVARSHAFRAPKLEFIAAVLLLETSC